MNKQKKIKIIVGVFIFLLGSIGCMYFTIYLDTLLSRGELNSDIFKIRYIMGTLKEGSKAFKLFICLELLVFLGSIFYVLKNDRFYESELIKVTPKISIPIEAGQKQFGSARFMTDEEKESFGVLYIKKDKKIKAFIDTGFDDVKSLKRGGKNRTTN